MKKKVISYRDFVAFKNDYVKDSDPLFAFGAAFCRVFGIDNPLIHKAKSVEEGTVAIEKELEFII